MGGLTTARILRHSQPSPCESCADATVHEARSHKKNDTRHCAGCKSFGHAVEQLPNLEGRDNILSHGTARSGEFDKPWTQSSQDRRFWCISGKPLRITALTLRKLLALMKFRLNKGMIEREAQAKRWNRVTTVRSNDCHGVTILNTCSFSQGENER